MKNHTVLGNNSSENNNKNSNQNNLQQNKLKKKKHHYILICSSALLLITLSVISYFYFSTTSKIKSAHTGPEAAQQAKHEINKNKYVPDKAKKYLKDADTHWNNKEKSIDVNLTPENTQKVEQAVANHPDLANSSKAEKISKAQEFISKQNHLYDNIRLVDPQTGQVIIQVQNGNVIQMNTDNLNTDTLKNSQQQNN